MVYLDRERVVRIADLLRLENEPEPPRAVLGALVLLLDDDEPEVVLRFHTDAERTTSWRVRIVTSRGLFAYVDASADRPGWSYDDWLDAQGKVSATVAAGLRSLDDLVALELRGVAAWMPPSEQQWDWSARGTWELRWRDETTESLDLGRSPSQARAEAADRLVARLRKSLMASAD
jgi:hypothetical protein